MTKPAKATLRCYKQVCAEPPKHVLSPMQGVVIRACDKHLDDAKVVATTGRHA